MIFQWTYSQCKPRDVIWNQNFGHIGTGLPYATGAMLADLAATKKQRPGMLLTSDSSFLFHIGELETAVRCKLPLVCVVGVDYQWGLEVGVYKRTFGQGTAETGTHRGKSLRFDKIGEGFGCHGEFVTKARRMPRRARGLTELSADWFWETDAEHRVRWLSGGAPVATFFGGTPTYGKTFWEIPGVEVEERALETHLERLGERQPIFDLELARRDERGARQVHIVSGQVRLDAGGEFLGYRGVGRDITEQRAAERALWHAKERLELALDGGNLAEFHFDTERRELSAGDGWVRFLGHERSPQVTMGAELIAMMHPEDRVPYTEALVRALKGESRPSTPTSAFPRARANGNGCMRAAAWPIATPDGRARRLSGTVADIDEQKRAEAALAEREQRFRDVVDASGEYVWETDAAWRYTYLSERAEAVLGYPRAELLGSKPREFMPLGEPGRSTTGSPARAAEGKPFRDLLHRMITQARAG